MDIILSLFHNVKCAKCSGKLGLKLRVKCYKCSKV